jgi:A/G-specific adenine glycosylase
MDLGSQICRPQAPDCERCPLKTCCDAFTRGLQNELPRRKPRTPVTAVDEVCVVIRRRNKYLLRRRTDGERWAGMWDFVRFEVDESELDLLPFAGLRNRRHNNGTSERNLFTATATVLPETIRRRVYDQAGTKVSHVTAATEFMYSVTRYRVCLMSFLCDGTTAGSSKVDGTQWFTAEEMTELPLSKTGRLVAQWLTSRAQ